MDKTKMIETMNKITELLNNRCLSSKDPKEWRLACELYSDWTKTEDYVKRLLK